MSTVAILQETLPFDFEPAVQLPAGSAEAATHASAAYSEQDRQSDEALCKSYFFGWTRTFGSGRDANQKITFEEFRAAAQRLAQ